MKVIIKHKTQSGRNTKYRAGSLQDLPDSVADELIRSGHAIEYKGPGVAIAPYETRVEEPKETRVINSKRKNALEAAKRKLDEKKAAIKAHSEPEKVEEEKVVEVEKDNSNQVKKKAIKKPKK